MIPKQIPYREVDHGGASDAKDPPEQLNTGHTDSALHDRHVTVEDRKRWRAEDEARDLRRIPLGFRG